MIPDWLLKVTQAAIEWHGSLPDWAACLVGVLFAVCLCVISAGIMLWIETPRQQRTICHACGREVPIKYLKRVKTSSDPRHQGTELCRSCFDEIILRERWSHIPGIKWFDGGTP